MADKSIVGLAERMRAYRAAKGFGGERDAAAFARLLGISPPSLNQIENGRTVRLGPETILRILEIGGQADVNYLVKGVGRPMKSKDIETTLRAQTAAQIMHEIPPERQILVVQMLEQFRRDVGGSSVTDPFAGLKPPPVSPGDKPKPKPRRKK